MYFVNKDKLLILLFKLNYQKNFLRAAADIELSGSQDSRFADFLDRIREDLNTGETAWLEIEGINRPVRLTVSESPDAM